MGLKNYQGKRDFNKTAEPKGTKRANKSNLFAIQKHAASHLHYDFRIALHGVLLSWAVPKGPCLDPHIKRLAVQVEDHPLEYASFEGMIPKGQYGGGTVMLWDKGTWEPLDENPTQAYQKGHLRFELRGHKLQGRWDLFRFKNQKNWFLVKYNDNYAKPLQEYDITEAEPLSVLSLQSMEEISDNDQPALILSHPDKILYPEDNYSKQDLLEYYELVSDYLLPFIKNRLLSLLRCPDTYQTCFFQRHTNQTTPKTLKSMDIESKGEVKPYLYLTDKSGLLSLVQMSVLEIHPWGSLIPDVEKPDRVTFDLDPAPDVDWKTIVAAAFEIRDELAQLKLASFVKTTGGKGLHVVLPIEAEHDWEVVKQFTQAFVTYLEKRKPGQYISKMTKARRGGKIFVDYLRNQRGATAISAYSTRSRIHAPVSVPLEWEELTNRQEDTVFTIKTVPLRLQGLQRDPWSSFWTTRQSLPFPNF